MRACISAPICTCVLYVCAQQHAIFLSRHSCGITTEESSRGQRRCSASYHKSRWRYAIANRHGCVSAGTRVARARAIARVLQCVAECCSMLQLVTECCSEIADAMGHGSVLQCVAVCCSELQRVAACCNVLQFVLIVLQCVAACCSVLQRDAACCSVLQCVAVCCSVLP